MLYTRPLPIARVVSAIADSAFSRDGSLDIGCADQAGALIQRLRSTRSNMVADRTAWAS